MDNTTPKVGQHWRVKRLSPLRFVSYDDVVISDISEDGQYVQTTCSGFPWMVYHIDRLQRDGQYIKPNWFWRLFGYT